MRNYIDGLTVDYIDRICEITQADALYIKAINDMNKLADFTGGVQILPIGLAISALFFILIAWNLKSDFGAEKKFLMVLCFVSLMLGGSVQGYLIYKGYPQLTEVKSQINMMQKPDEKVVISCFEELASYHEIHKNL